MKHTKKRAAALLLALAMVLSLMPMALAAAGDAAGFPDMPAEDDASYAAVKSAVDNGLLKGEDGKLNLEGSMTRATMAALITRIFGAKGEADMSAFSDAEGHWAVESGELPAAVAMGIMNGSNGKMLPNDQVTLEQVITMLVRALGLPMGTADDLKDVAGADSVTAWAVPYVAALVKAGYDVPDLAGAAQPMTRVEFTEMIYKVSGGNYVKEAGEITEDVDGNIIITADGVSLKGITVKGDVIIADGVDAGSVKLDGVKIEGRLVIRGAAAAELTNTTAASTVVAAPAGEVTVKADDASDAGAITVTGTDSKAAEKVTVDMAEPKVTVEAGTTLAVQNAKGGEVTLRADGAKVAVESGTVANVTVADGAKDVAVDVAADATIEKVTTNTDLAVTGEGTVTEKEGSGTVTDAAGNEVAGSDEPADVPSVVTPSIPDEADPNKPGNPAHTHTWSDPKPFDATRHIRVCEAAAGDDADAGDDEAADADEPCGATTYEAHSFTVACKPDGTVSQTAAENTALMCACGEIKPGTVTEEETTEATGDDAYNCPEGTEHHWVLKSSTAATCTAEGSKVYVCDNKDEAGDKTCGATKTETIAQLPHSYKVVSTTAASCDEAGEIAYECTACTADDEGHTKTVEIPATGKHNWVLKQTVPATCTTDGKYVYECTTCTGETPATSNVPITKLGHSFSSTWSKDETQHWHACVHNGCEVKDGAASHDTDGADGACSVCGYKASGTTEPTHTHSKGSTIKSDENQHWYICDGGKDGCDEQKYDATNHDWGSNATSPNGKCTGCDVTHTCDTSGTDGACSKCGYKEASSGTP